MSDHPLTPARHTDVVRNLAYALRYDRAGERVSDREPLSATLTAEHLAEALRLSGFVVMRTPSPTDTLSSIKFAAVLISDWNQANSPKMRCGAG